VSDQPVHSFVQLSVQYGVFQLQTGACELREMKATTWVAASRPAADVLGRELLRVLGPGSDAPTRPPEQEIDG
jgi:hypothetical protein